MAICFVWISFVLWRRMRSDYEEEQVLGLTATMAVSAIGGAYLAGIAELAVGQTRIWGTVVMVVLVLWWWCKKNKWNFWEWLDEVGRWSLVVLILGGLGWGPKGWVYASLNLIGFLLVNLISKTYRRIKWYRSGKLGIVGLVAIGWWAVVEIAVAKYWRPDVYLPTSPGFVLPIVTLMTIVVGIYIRSGHTLMDDLTELWQKISPTKK